MKNKNLLITMLMALLLFSLIIITSCERKPEGPITLNMWSLFGGADGEVFHNWITEFNKSQDKIKVIHNITDWEGNYYGKLAASISGGNAPDIAIVHTRNLPAFASEEVLYNVKEGAKEAGFSESLFQEIPWKGSMVDGKQFGIPLDVIVAMVLYYNKDYMEKAGLTNPPKNAAEFIEFSKKIKEATGKWGAYVPVRGFILYRYWYSILYQNEGSILNGDNTKANFNNEAGVNALQFLLDMIYKEKIASNIDLGIQGEGFKFSKVGFSMDGIWHVSGYEKQADLKFGVASIPEFGKPGNRSFFSNSHNFVFPKQPEGKESREKQKACLEFVKWMSDHSLTWGEKAGMVPARKDIIESDAFLALPRARTLLEQIKFAKYPPPIKKTEEIQTPIISALEAAMAREKTPEEALEEAETEVNKILSE
ncbi:MAG: ABC transporter substrate-binding protein [Spirochaetales bacterium]|nr:ABC transporter substrate-binding protein [Spirochaetales bacterium]